MFCVFCGLLLMASAAARLASSRRMRRRISAFRAATPGVGAGGIASPRWKVTVPFPLIITRAGSAVVAAGRVAQPQLKSLPVWTAPLIMTASPHLEQRWKVGRAQAKQANPKVPSPAEEAV